MTDFEIMTNAAEENAVWLEKRITELRKKLAEYKRERLASQQELEELFETMGERDRDALFLLLPFVDKMWARFRALEN